MRIYNPIHCEPKCRTHIFSLCMFVCVCVYRTLSPRNIGRFVIYIAIYFPRFTQIARKLQTLLYYVFHLLVLLLLPLPLLLCDIKCIAIWSCHLRFANTEKERERERERETSHLLLCGWARKGEKVICGKMKTVFSEPSVCSVLFVFLPMCHLSASPLSWSFFSLSLFFLHPEWNSWW